MKNYVLHQVYNVVRVGKNVAITNSYDKLLLVYPYAAVQRDGVPGDHEMMTLKKLNSLAHLHSIFY